MKYLINDLGKITTDIVMTLDQHFSEQGAEEIIIDIEGNCACCEVTIGKFRQSYYFDFEEIGYA